MSWSQDKFLSLLEIWIKLVCKPKSLSTSEHSPRLHLWIRQEDHSLASGCAEGLGLGCFCLFGISQWEKIATAAMFAKPASPQALDPFGYRGSRWEDDEEE